ncbi:MAG: GTP cyclohydrolase II [Pseudohongiellaceae bacterium]
MSVKHVSSSRLPTQYGDFAIYAFEDAKDRKEHVALVLGELKPDMPVLTRVHSECLTGDALFSLRCDCGSQLQEAMQRIAGNGSGVILYLRQEGRAIGLINKIRAYQLQDQGADTVDANISLGFEPDERSYDICKPIFDHLGISSIELMTNNPLKVEALQKLGIDVVKRLPIIAGENFHNEAYLATKRSKMGHIKD